MSDNQKPLVTLLFLLMATCVYTQREKLFFRKDYTFIEETESFYKFHTIGRQFDDALNMCQMEGATLFYPEDAREANAVIDYWKKVQSPYNTVLIAVNSFIAEGAFVTIDGKAISEVYDNWAPGEPNNVPPGEHCVELIQNGFLNDYNCDGRRPFICKKTLATLYWNHRCNLPDYGYRIERSVGKCYKFHLEPKSWQEAYATCVAEQTHLAIISSQEESNILARITAQAPKDSAVSKYDPWVHLGFRKTPRGWYTVRGVRLENSGFSSWDRGQPDNAGGTEDCGSMHFNGLLNDITCSNKLFFICQRDLTWT